MFPCILEIARCEKGTLDGTLERCFSLKEFPTKDSKSQGINISFKLLEADLKQVRKNQDSLVCRTNRNALYNVEYATMQIREEHPHLVFGNVSIVRKMGFPEVILPGDVRNDLYLTLVSGEFSKGSKSTDKNIEVAVTVCGEKGVPLQVSVWSAV